MAKRLEARAPPQPALPLANLVPRKTHPTRLVQRACPANPSREPPGGVSPAARQWPEVRQRPAARARRLVGWARQAPPEPREWMPTRAAWQPIPAAAAQPETLLADRLWPERPARVVWAARAVQLPVVKWTWAMPALVGRQAPEEANRMPVLVATAGQPVPLTKSPAEIARIGKRTRLAQRFRYVSVTLAMRSAKIPSATRRRRLISRARFKTISA